MKNSGGKWNGDKIKKEFKSAVEYGLDRVGILIVGEAVVRCPVDTSNLKGSITHKVIGEKAVRVGTGVAYAAFVEYGKGQANKEKNSRAEIPFLRPAIDENHEKILSLFKEITGRSL